MLELSRAGYDAIVDHACERYPREVCGILGGDYSEEHTRVTSVHRAANAADSPRTEYIIDPAEQFELMDAIRAAGEDVAGFYHSHPEGPSRPSEEDVVRATWPGRSYVVVSLDGTHPYVGSWRWDDGAGEFAGERLRLR